MYKNQVGANIDNYDDREQYKYNFIYIIKDPTTRIYKGGPLDSPLVRVKWTHASWTPHNNFF